MEDEADTAPYALLELNEGSLERVEEACAVCILVVLLLLVVASTALVEPTLEGIWALVKLVNGADAEVELETEFGTYSCPELPLEYVMDEATLDA